ncbi:MAG: hypothetical protein H6641_23710 [Caldilineaceae bacterium]|nr:hypothetical protein [Caldilineaceae bacterium]
MVADAQILEDIVLQVNQLTPEYRLLLIQRISASLLPFTTTKTTPLQFGKYKNNKMSTLEDFAVAEWHPADDELNGA